MKYEFRTNTGEIRWSGEADTFAQALWESRRTANHTDVSLQHLDLTAPYCGDMSNFGYFGIDFSYSHFYGVNLYNSQIVDAKLRSLKARGCNFSGALFERVDLRDARLWKCSFEDCWFRRVDLRGASLECSSWPRLGPEIKLDRHTVLPTGETFREYLSKTMPELLTFGGKSLESLTRPDIWRCHSWSNCPLANAFSVHSPEDLPSMLKPQVDVFLRLFDAGLLPCPGTEPYKEIVA